MKQFVSFLLTIVLCTAMSVSGFAHSGRTDSSGGHKDNKNVSGLGSYHYHHGYPAHLHTNGVCPYEKPVSTSTTTTVSKPVEKPKQYLIYTDIIAKVNGNAIQSYNYNGDTYVNCNDLNSYGFDVTFDSSSKAVTITRSADKKITPLDITKYPKGKVAYEISATAIKVYISASNGKVEVASVNGGGNMYVKFSALSAFGESEWDNTNRIANLKLY